MVLDAFGVRASNRRRDPQRLEKSDDSSVPVPRLGGQLAPGFSEKNRPIGQRSHQPVSLQALDGANDGHVRDPERSREIGCTSFSVRGDQVRDGLNVVLRSLLRVLLAGAALIGRRFLLAARQRDGSLLRAGAVFCALRPCPYLAEKRDIDKLPIHSVAITAHCIVCYIFETKGEMTGRARLIAPALAALGIFFAAGGAVAQEKVKAAVTIGMAADLVRQVGGDRVEVDQLMGPGVDPHLYKPTATDAGRLSKADVIFYSGLMLEGRMGDLFAKLARAGKKVYPITESVPEELLTEPKEFQGHYDPHIWFDVSMWAQTVPTIVKG